MTTTTRGPETSPAAPLEIHAPRRWPELDGLRAWAIVAVMCGHAGFQFAGGGGVGVDMFFVLSGFLITFLLLREHDRAGRISLFSFYRRRILRLWPAFAVLIGGVSVYSATFAQYSLGWTNLHELPWALYVANWAPVWIGSYLHTWSLSVEEQFYLCWPLLLLLIVRLHSRRAVAGVLATLAILDGAYRAIAWQEWGFSLGRVIDGTDTRADGLLLGCALAFALTVRGEVRPICSERVRNRASIIGAIAVLSVIYVGRFSPAVLLNGGYSVVVIGTAAMVLAAVTTPPRWMRWVLDRPTVVHIGRISYSLYLWHLPVYVAVQWTEWGARHPGLDQLIEIPISLFFAEFSYWLVELPFLRLKERRPLSGEHHQPIGSPAPGALGI